MATLTVTVPNAKAAAVLAAIERLWKSEAVNLYYGGLPAGYEADTAQNQAQACIRAFLTRAYQDEVRRQAVNAIPPSDDPGVS